MSLLLMFVLVVVVLWAAFAYNRLIRLRNQVAAAWSDIDVQLQRRFDLIPNLLKVVQGYCQHERETLSEVAARWQSHRPAGEQRQEQENRLGQALGSLFAVAEDYPQLWANEQFQGLHQALIDVEDYLQYARRYYNGSVRDFNNQLESFPDILITRLFSFQARSFFEIERAVHRQAPEVRL